MIALEGVTRHGLGEAVKAILKGALGHAFLPSPPELRIQCEKAMEHHRWMRDHIKRRERSGDDTGAIGPQTPESRARVSAAYADFCKSYETASAEDTMKLDPELVALVPDNPKSIAKSRLGRA